MVAGMEFGFWVADATFLGAYPTLNNETLGDYCLHKFAFGPSVHFNLISYLQYHNICHRIFWVTVMITSGMGMAIIFKFTLQSFEQDVINVNVETSFLHWTNAFPAVSMCMTKGGDATKILTFLTAYWKANGITPPKNEIRFASLVRSYMFFSPNQQLEKEDYCEIQNKTCGIDQETFLKAFTPQKCSDFITELTFLGRQYDCNEIFKPIKTEMGQCFTANSLHIHKDSSKLSLLYGYSHRKLALHFKYIEKSDVFKFVMYIHSPEELPYFDMEPILLRKSQIHNYFYETIEIINTNEVKLQAIDLRHCRFPDERVDKSFIPYSFSSCFTDKRIALELALCNCTMHTSPVEYTSNYCDYQGLLCINDAHIPEKIKMEYKTQGMCIQSCIEMEINNLGEIIDNLEVAGEVSEVVIEILNTPTIRYVRNVTKTKLDFVVSIGGLVGLFFGASLLSLVEFGYIWLIRRF